MLGLHLTHQQYHTRNLCHHHTLLLLSQVLCFVLNWLVYWDMIRSIFRCCISYYILLDARDVLKIFLKNRHLLYMHATQILMNYVST